MIVTKRFHFYAAHRNVEIGGKCANLHGHNYSFILHVEHEKKGSVTIPFDAVEDAMKPFMSKIDHSVLVNRFDPEFGSILSCPAMGNLYVVGFETSAENLAIHLLALARSAGLNAIKIELKETESASVIATLDDLTTADFQVS